MVITYESFKTCAKKYSEAIFVASKTTFVLVISTSIKSLNNEVLTWF